MKDLNTIQEKVRTILEENPRTRDNDMLLYLKLAGQIDNMYQQDSITKPFEEVIVNMKRYHLPSFGSVGRTRRKLQTKYPELRATENVQEFRTNLEEEYKEYSRG